MTERECAKLRNERFEALPERGEFVRCRSVQGQHCVVVDA